MIITYRPELENPPMAKECSMGFSFLPENENVRNVNHVRMESGVNRNVRGSHLGSRSRTRAS